MCQITNRCLCSGNQPCDWICKKTKEQQLEYHRISPITKGTNKN